MQLPKPNQEVLVQLNNGSFAVAQFIVDEEDPKGFWYAGTGIIPSHDYGSNSLSGEVVAWSKLPTSLENNLEESKNKPKMK